MPKPQPGILVDNRLDLPGSGDILTPEQFTPDRGMVDEEGKPAVWEGCQTFSGSWGYFRDETSWKSVKMCIEMLVNHVSRGGNLLMNVGPTSRGYIDARAMERLAGYAEWMKAGPSTHLKPPAREQVEEWRGIGSIKT